MHKIIKTLGIIVILVLLTGIAQASDWPMFHHDARHTGYTDESIPDDLELLWSYETGNCVDSSPAVANGKVFAESDDYKIYCLDEDDGSLIWSYKSGGMMESSPAVANGKVFIGSPEGEIYCLNENTGELIWSYKTGRSVWSSPAVADGKVFIGSGDHKIYCLDEDTGNLIWNYETGGDVRSPAVANGMVFVGSCDHKIYCLNENTGKLIWSYKVGGLVVSSPAVAYGKVFVGSHDHKIYCLSENTGNLIWSFETGDTVHSSPAVANGKVFIGSDDDRIYCLDGNTGELIWSYKTGHQVFSSPAVANGKVFVGSRDNHIYCLDEDNGNLIWSYETGGSVLSSPAVANGMVFFGSCDDKIYCFGAKPTPSPMPTPRLTPTPVPIPVETPTPIVTPMPAPAPTSSSSQPEEPEIVTVQVGDVSVGKGEFANIFIMIKGVRGEGLSAALLNLTYDPSVVKVVSAENSDFDMFMPNIGDGKVRMVAFQTGAEGLKGDVKFAEMKMKAVGKANESSELELEVKELTDIVGKELKEHEDFEVENGYFWIAPTVPSTATATPIATPAEAPTPTPSPFTSIPPIYILSAAAVIVIILIAGIGISRKRKKGKSAKPQPPTEPPKPETEPVKEEPIIKKETPPPISESITIERTIYDPCKRDFIEGRLPRMKEWINSYDPGAYWFAMSIQNNTDKTIEEWGVELGFSSALKIEEAKIEGIKIEIPQEAHLNSFKISVPKEYGIVIPKEGAQRVYFKLRAEKPKTTYEISGVFKSEITGDVQIRAKEFKYLCDTGVSPEAVKVELKKTFSEKDAARLANTFRVVQEIRSSYCNTGTTAKEINKEFDLLKMYLNEKDFLDEIGGIQRRINAELREDERLDDKHVEEVKDFCEKFTEMWIAKFLR